MMKLENFLLQDMRRYYFKSVSLLIYIAITTYLDRVIAYYLAKFCEEQRDNYPYLNYTYKEKCTEEAICVTVWWGVPPNFMKEYFR